MAETTSKKRKSIAPLTSDSPATNTLQGTAEVEEDKKRTKTTPSKRGTSSTPKDRPAKRNVETLTSKAAKSSKTPPTERAAPTDDVSGFSSEDDTATAAHIAPDQAALLAGFSSDSDSDDDDLRAPLTKLPAPPSSQDLQSQLDTAAADPESTPGVVYVGRIPHGFYEPQMKAYFSQFGTVLRLRLSRNKLTGRSKHYAFIEFESAAVADIVAKTMDKYLMFGHILQVRRLKDEEVHPELWKGAGTRFKAMPRAKLEGGKLERGLQRQGWEKRIDKETKRRKQRAEKLKDLGYEFEVPQLRSVDIVPKQVPAIESAEDTVKEQVVEEAGQDGKEATDETDDNAAEPTVTGVADEGTEHVDVSGTKRSKGRKEKKRTKKVRLST